MEAEMKEPMTKGRRLKHPLLPKISCPEKRPEQDSQIVERGRGSTRNLGGLRAGAEHLL